MLARSPGSRIVHDPRLTWNTREIVEMLGGTPVQTKTGHAFIKERMRQEDAVYGGEMSAHHYFRNFAYCDSGMIPWLLIAGIVSATGQPLSHLVGERIRRFPCSGEINRRLADPAAAMVEHSPPLRVRRFRRAWWNGWPQSGRIQRLCRYPAAACGCARA